METVALGPENGDETLADNQEPVEQTFGRLVARNLERSPNSLSERRHHANTMDGAKKVSGLGADRATKVIQKRFSSTQQPSQIKVLVLVKDARQLRRRRNANNLIVQPLQLFAQLNSVIKYSVAEAYGVFGFTRA